MNALRRIAVFCAAFALATGCAPKAEDVTPAPEPSDSGTPVEPASVPQAGATVGPQVLLISNASSPFWNAVDTGLQAGAQEMGVPARLERNDGTVGGQIKLLEQALSDKDRILGVGISVLRPDAEGILQPMKALMDAGVPVITIDSDCQPEYRQAFVGTDNKSAGKALGAKTAELQPEGGKVCAFVGDPSSQNANDRIGGFKEGAGDKFEVIEVYKDDTDPAKARSNVEAALTAHPDASVFLGIWSYNGPAIAEVVENAKKQDDVLVVTFDAEPNLLPILEAGKIKVSLVQKPYEMGRQAVMMLKALADHDEVQKQQLLPDGGDHVDTGFSLETPASFPDFKKYLDEKGLKSS